MDMAAHRSHAAAEAATLPAGSGTPVEYGARADDAHRHAHVVQFYASDDFLVRAVSEYVASGLAHGEACVLFLTPAHRTALEQRLQASGCDLATAQRRGRYVPIDAAATVARIIVAGMPERARFAAIVGPRLARAARCAQRDVPPAARRLGLPVGGHRVRVFGEMVALLWMEGHVAAAIHLEALWSEWQRTTPVPFALLCAYPAREFAGEANEAPLAQICAHHAQVLPDERYTALRTEDERQRAIVLLQQRAASLEDEIAERKAAEERLQLSEIRYRRLFESSTDGILIVDPLSGTISEANPAMARLLGMSPGELVGQPLWQTGLFSDEAAAMRAMQRVERHGVLRDESLALRAGDSQVRDLEVVGIRFRANARAMVQWNVRDITTRRRLERRTREALDALLTMAEELVAVDVPAASAPAAHTPGAGSDAVPCASTTAWDDGATPYGWLADSGVAPPHAVDDDMLAAIASPAGAVVRGARAAADVPSHPVALRLAQLTRQVLGCARVGLAALDPATRRLTPLAVVGLPPDLTQPWWAAVASSQGDGSVAAVGLQAGEPVVLEVTGALALGQPGSGTERTLVVPLCLRGAIIGALIAGYGPEPHRFTTEEISLARAVAKLATMVVERERLLRDCAAARAHVLALREVNRRLDEFIGIAGHELRTPLTSAKAAAQLAERRLRRFAEEATTYPATVAAPAVATQLASLRDLVGHTVRALARQERLVNDLLDLSRIQVGTLVLSEAPCDLVQIVREAVAEQRLLFPDRAIALALPRRHAHIALRGDADRLMQVLTNYLSNALKYSPADQPVVVRVRVDEHPQPHARVTVRDHGPGLPAVARQQIWTRFYRAAGVEVRYGSGIGLGLGLFICRTIIERLGGQVGVTSKPGAGACFWFTLPTCSV